MSLEREYGADGNALREDLRSADGELIRYTVYRYVLMDFFSNWSPMRPMES